MRQVSLISRLPYYQKCLSCCAVHSGFLCGNFSHQLGPLGLVPCAFYKHEFKPKARYGTRTKDSLVLTERTDGVCFYHHPTTEEMEVAKIILEFEGVSSRVTHIMLPSFTHMVHLIRKQNLNAVWMDFSGLQLLIRDWKNGSPSVAICSFAGIGV